MATRKPQIARKDEDEICELEHLRKLFIGGLAPYTNEDGLRSFYGQYGKVVDCIVMRDPASKKSRGFGFVTFSKAYMVDQAQEARPHTIDGKIVEAKRALPRPERESSESNATVRKIFIGGLKDNHDEECLRDHFSQFGNILNIKIVTDKTTGKRRGFAYIEFDDYDAVDKAILQKTHSIKYVLVDVKKSVYKQEMQKRAAASNNIDTSANGQIIAPPTPAASAQGGPQQSNYNWGPPPNYNGYYQQPPPNNWNWNQPPQNSWNGAPPPPPQGPWNQGSYGPPPSQTNWNSGPPPSQSSWNGGYSSPPQTNWTTGPPPTQNLGTGYQQSYSGGAQKSNLGNSTRKNPYNVPTGTGKSDTQQQQSSSNGMNGRRY